MSELKMISPLLDNISVGGAISDHHGIRCYPAMNDTTGDKYIVKVITIPASRTQLDAFLLSGAYANEADALSYFKEQADDLLKEAEALKKLSNLDGYFSYEQFQLVPMEDEIGLQIYLLGSYRPTLDRLMQRQPMTYLSAVNLGLDLCAALTVCRNSGYLYLDLKPSNIFIAQDNSYKIGDLGLVSLNALGYASLPDKYRSPYTAPEITDAFSNLNTTLDVYALGRILYQIYNNGELIDVSNEALDLPAPANADYEMSEIILKACATDPNDRWSTPEEMGQALVSYMQRNGANDTPIVPPLIPSADPIDDAADDTCEVQDLDNAVQLQSNVESEVPKVQEVPENEEKQDATESDPEQVDPIVIQDAFADETNISDDTDTDTPATDPLGEELNNIAVLLQPSDDETAPENTEGEISYDEVSQEINDILTQADEIVSHPVPDPVVAPDPIEVPVPDPIVISESSNDITENNTETENESNTDDESKEPQDLDSGIADDSDDTQNITEKSTDENFSDTTVAEDNEPDCDDEETDEDDESVVTSKKKKGSWILYVILALLLAGLVTIGIYFYQNYYLLPVDSMTLSGDETSLTVNVQTSIDESLLTVVCKGQHGVTLQAPLKNGTASFTNLQPDTAYVISLNVSGFHKLTGEVSKGYSTPKVVNISDFKIYTSSTAGTVDVYIASDNSKTETWKLSYSTTGENERTKTIQGTYDQVENLTIGKKYTFVLEPASGVTVKGTNKVTHTVTVPIYAQLQTIDSCSGGSMVVTWLPPKDANPVGWTVTCKDSSGNVVKTINVAATAETSARFDSIDDAATYTVDIVSDGMKDGVSVTKPEGAPVLADAVFTKTDVSAKLTWSGTGPWTVICTADGHVLEEIKADKAEYSINTLVPNTTYCITVKTPDGTVPIGGMKAFTTPAAESFTCTYENHSVNADDLTANMCAIGSVRGRWTSKHYANSFKVGEEAGILLTKENKHGYSADNYIRIFAIYDKDGVLVTASSTENQWYLMWPYANSCELEIPSMPSKAGEYTLHLFFNNQLVATNDFTVTE